jgi:hypothetical protein
MYNIKFAETDEEYRQVAELWSSKTTLMRHSIDGALDQDVRRGKIAAALTAEGEVVGTLRSISWIENIGLPFYSIGGFYLKTGLVKQLNFSSQSNPTGAMLDLLLAHEESRGFYNWYYIRPLGKAYSKIREDGNELLAHSKLGVRYRRDVEEVVLPGQRSNFRMHNNLLLNRTWQRPMMIIKCSLENKYRVEGDLFEKESTYYQEYKDF